jgi:hypothetical protein
VSFARAEDGSTVELVPGSDNWARLQTFIDAHTSIYLPAGRWQISRTLNLRSGREITGCGVEATTIDLAWPFPGPVIAMGGNGSWQGSQGYGRADGVTLRGFRVLMSFTHLEAHNAAAGYTFCKTILNDLGDDFTACNIRVEGTPYEGFTVGSTSKRATLRHIESINCGNGGPARSLPVAGVNPCAIDTLIDGFVVRRCGHGIESGNTRVTIRNGLITEPGTDGIGVGIVIGSSSLGVYRTTVEDCVVRGYNSSMGAGNGSNGRLAGVTFQRNDVDGGIGFTGGKMTNNVVLPDEGDGPPNQGPDTEGSYIIDNVIRVNSPLSGSVIAYHSGLADTNGLYGREPLTIARNRILFGFSNPALMTNAVPIGFYGKIGAACVVEGNVISGLSAAPSNGDIRNETVHANPTIPLMPNLSVRANLSLNASGSRRTTVVKRT